MDTLEELIAERDAARKAWSGMDLRVRRAQVEGTNIHMLALMQGQARFLWAEYESRAARVTMHLWHNRGKVPA